MPTLETPTRSRRRPILREHTRRCTYTLFESVANTIEAEAERRYVTASHLVREALDLWLERQEAQPGDSP
jgi:Arc/MetJ-type ribon-helix-helix transcriptional regulator